MMQTAEVLMPMPEEPPVEGAAPEASDVRIEPTAVQATSGVQVAPASMMPKVKKMRRLEGYARDARSALLGAISISIIVGFWYLATKYQWDFYVRFDNIPSPGAVLHDFLSLGQSVVFYKNMWVSLERIFAGFAIAAVSGVTLGMLIGRYRLAKDMLFPPIELMRPIPAIAWVPISIMLWPTNESSIVFITFLGAFFPITINTIHGVMQVDKVLLRAAKCLGAGEMAILREIVFPSALPQIFTGLSVGMGVAWVSLIAAEMISGQFGIGYFTWEAYSLIQYQDIVVGMIVIGILGLLCSGLIRLAGNMLMPWVANSRKGASA